MTDEQLTAEKPEVAEVFEFKNPITYRTMPLPKTVKTERGDVDLQSLLEGVIGKARADAKNEYRAKIEDADLKVKDFDALQKRLEEFEANGMTAAQKAKLENDKSAGEIRKAREEAQRAKENLNSYILKNAVLDGFSKVKNLTDIAKAAVLFNNEYKPKLVDKNGEFIPVVDYEGQELPVSEVQAKWIARDDNKFLLQNTLSPGGGSTGGNSSITTKQMKRADFDALKPVAQMAFITDGGLVSE